MKLVHDAEDDIASLQLTDEIAEGEVAQDVGPQLTPNRQTVTMGYDDAGNLMSIEFWAASRVLRPTLLRSGIVHIEYDEIANNARLRLTDEPVDDSELLVVGPQLTPTGDRIVLAYDSEDFLVRIEIEGADRVLRDETLG
jgi:YD repeat-containing protein